jgi:endonuclease/exonuclease/phosphatase family metal-dependent hydrolase
MRYAIVVLLAASTACVGNRPPASPTAVPPTCAARSTIGLRWIRAAPAREAASLDRWCEAVGPPARVQAARTEESVDDLLAVVSWNVHVGAGDIDALVADLRSSRLTGRRVSAFILLLQEAYRGGHDVPEQPARGARWASAQPGDVHGLERSEIVAASRRLGLSAIYVPSMRNGAPTATREDRGNAILSTLPLSDATAIELPLERQRRVAVEATVTLRRASGAPMPMHVITTHFTNMVMHHAWLFSEPGRDRQARALARVLPADGTLVVGGDFNSWFGFHDAAYRELAKGLRTADVTDRRPTFGPMRLDHLLFRLPDGWRATVARAASRYGSDHYPLVALIEAR